jgi:hypothetical protein
MNQVRTFVNDKGVEIKHEIFECTLAHNIPVYIEGKMAGRALIVEVVGQEWDVLLDIYIYDEKDRGKSYGSQILDYIKTAFPKVLTNARNEKSKNFLLKNGFEQKKVLFKKQEDIYFYCKRED